MQTGLSPTRQREVNRHISLAPVEDVDGVALLRDGETPGHQEVQVESYCHNAIASLRARGLKVSRTGFRTWSVSSEAGHAADIDSRGSASAPSSRSLVVSRALVLAMCAVFGVAEAVNYLTPIWVSFEKQMMSFPVLASVIGGLGLATAGLFFRRRIWSLALCFLGAVDSGPAGK